MKLLAALFVALLMLGCMSEIYEGTIPVVLEIDLDDNETRNKIMAEAIDHEKLQANFASDRRGGKYYTPNQETPYTGWSKSMHENGQMMALWHFKDGKADGLWTKWFDNGQKKEEVTYKDGKWDGLEALWYSNGQKQAENTYKAFVWGRRSGKLVTAVGWKRNGEKSDSNVVNGNGVRVSYLDDGTERGRYTYKDGKIVLARPTPTAPPP